MLLVGVVRTVGRHDHLECMAEPYRPTGRPPARPGTFASLTADFVECAGS